VLLDDGPSRVLAALDERFGLAALWIFGSQATGRATPASDLDLAALFRRRPAPLDLASAEEALALALGCDVDLVDLDRASPALAMQVLKHGRLVLDADPTLRVRFLTTLPSRYEDLRRVRAPIERSVSERMHGRA
jgi:predicted nucleotidyltransferase